MTLHAETEREFFNSLRMAKPGDMLSLVDVDRTDYRMSDSTNGYYANILVSDGYDIPVTQLGYLLIGKGWQLGQFGAVLTLGNGTTIKGRETHYQDGVFIEFPLSEAISGKYEMYLSIGEVPYTDYIIVNMVNGREAGSSGNSGEFARAMESKPMLYAPQDSVLSRIAIIQGDYILKEWPEFWNPSLSTAEDAKVESGRKYPLIADPVFSMMTLESNGEFTNYREIIVDGEEIIHCFYDVSESVRIKLLTRDLTELKTIVIPKLMPIFGAATMDDKGNYYIAYGEKLLEENQKNEQNIVIAKYDSNGKLQGSAWFTAGEGYYNGTMQPFERTSAMAISGNILAVHFSRIMFKGSDNLNHQSSTVLYIDIDGMIPVGLPTPYTSHSLAQAAITTSDGGFLFANRGDGFPRGFAISKVFWAGLQEFTPFHFRELAPYQETNSSLAGIAETARGYLLAGSSERVLSNIAIPSAEGGPQDLFVQLIDKEFFAKDKREDTIVSRGETRRTEGIQNILGLNYAGGTSYFLAADLADYGVIWLTAYPAGQHVDNPRLVPFDDCFILLWERHEQKEYGYHAYLDTWYMILAGDCSVVKPATRIQGNPRLQPVFSLGYCDGKLYWLATEYHQGGWDLSLQSLAILDKPSNWATGQVEAAIEGGLVPAAMQSNYLHVITRAEFCSLAVQLCEKYMGQQITGRASFTDTTDINVQKMAALGVVSGVSETLFAPHSALTREQAASILVRLANVCGLSLPKTAATFSDSASISDWALESVGQVQAVGLMGGTGNGNFSPQDPYTREQSIVTLLRLFEWIR